MEKSEIIKALKCCADKEECNGCAYRVGKYTCNLKKLMRDTLRLIEELENGKK